MYPEPIEARVVRITVVGFDAQFHDAERTAGQFRSRRIIHREVLQRGAIVQVLVVTQQDRFLVVFAREALHGMGRKKDGLAAVAQCYSLVA